MSKQTNEPKKLTMNADSFGDIPPSVNIKEILGKTINIIGRYPFRIKHDSNSKYDKPDSDGMVTKYVVQTKQKFKAMYKGEQTDISNWYVSEGHYYQLDKLASDKNANTLDQMFVEGQQSPELVPCKKLGGQSDAYYTWLTPAAYKKELADGKLKTEN